MPENEQMQALRIKKRRVKVTPLTAEELRVPTGPVGIQASEEGPEEQPEASIASRKRKQPSEDQPPPPGEPIPDQPQPLPIPSPTREPTPVRSPSPENIYMDCETPNFMK